MQLFSFTKENGKFVLNEDPTAEDYTNESNGYAKIKVSVDDNTLDLTQGNLNDKFNGYQEIRTSAFAVEIDDSPFTAVLTTTLPSLSFTIYE